MEATTASRALPDSRFSDENLSAMDTATLADYHRVAEFEAYEAKARTPEGTRAWAGALGRVERHMRARRGR